MKRSDNVFSPVPRLGFSIACRAWDRSSGPSSSFVWATSQLSRVLTGSPLTRVLSRRPVTRASGWVTAAGCEEVIRPSKGSSTRQRLPVCVVHRSPELSTTAREPRARSTPRLSSRWRVGGSTCCGRCCVTEAPSRLAQPLNIFIEILLRGWVNKGLRSLLCRLTPEPGDPSCDDCGCPDGYELAYSVPCANPYHHLPKEAPRVQDAPVHVALHVTPKARVLPALQVRVPYNQHGS